MLYLKNVLLVENSPRRPTNHHLTANVALNVSLLPEDKAVLHNTIEFHQAF